MTQANPVTFGGLAAPERTYYYEVFVGISTPGAITSGTGLQFTVASITMPWPGTLTADLYHSGYYNFGLVSIACIPYGTTPTTSFTGSMTEYCGIDAWDQVGYWAQWIDLTAGQVVSVGVDVRHQLGPTTWNCSSIAGSIRMCRT